MVSSFGMMIGYRGKGIKASRRELTRVESTLPINNQPEYDMKYVSAYIVNYCYGTDLKKIIRIEWEYDTLSVVKPDQSLVAWAIINIKPKKTYFSGWRRYRYEIKSEDLMKYHWDNKYSKAKTPDGSTQIIQRAYRNYKKRPETFAKQVWKAVRNDNTLKEKKFLNMPSREIRCTVNLNIWYSIDRLYRLYHVLQDQLYNYISYSKHKRRQLSDRLAIYAKQPKGTALRLKDRTLIIIV
ncbi:hypothetical protein C1646_772734 [Rhizophagus diaphanus]|nr:hypothetical protein C1646_772734 [Rhizophagus diaphanus] [Rhizophagus sp. MUCL 43196]